MRLRYRSRPGHVVQAVQMRLDFDSLIYQKWGATQRAKPDDWLVRNGDDTYTVDRDVFARTYREVKPGIYKKITRVWAEVARESGAIETLEGQSHYEVGDYLVSNHEDGTDAYCMTAARFESLYEPDGDDEGES